MRRAPRGLSVLIAAALTLALEVGLRGELPEAHAYEFWTRARTSGEVYTLQGFRLIGGEAAVGRRRFTQSVGLVLYDLGEFQRRRRRAGRAARSGLLVTWHSELRLEHDFGTYLTGRLVTSPGHRQDALDLIPELDESALSLTLLYGHLTVEGLLGGRLELELGRLAPLETLGALPIDGVRVRAAVARELEVRIGAGLAVRDTSPLGVASYELDGAPGAACHEYVEAAAGQLGSWQLIDRSRAIRDGKLTSDYELCPQREQAMPTLALALATRRTGPWHAELGYRIARSRTVGRLGAVDRLPTPDLGLYPNEAGQAPAWGTNLEQVYGSAQARLTWGPVRVEPLALVRASVVHSVIDRAELSASLGLGRHRVQPSVSRFVPTFDTDSIWNVFGARASLDLSTEYRYDGAATSGVGSIWARRYDSDEGPAAWAWGGSAGLERAVARRVSVLVRALADAGFGGRRAALSAAAHWRAPRAELTARGALVWVTPEASAGAASDPSTMSTAATTATLRLSDEVGVHALLELRAGSDGPGARALGVLDLALRSER
ncbi:MAG: hypothetical protein R3B48_05440 [Kofleriaceae bacterium]